jgi:PIN domain nuclease of toxin-antitoxin system
VLYLDTHIAIELGAERLNLAKEALRLLDRDPDLRISPIAVLEFQFLHEVGRLRPGPDVVIQTLASEFGLRVCDRPFDAVVRQACQEAWTRDPFDRIIVAQARLARAPLLTRDTTMQAHYEKALG